MEQLIKEAIIPHQVNVLGEVKAAAFVGLAVQSLRNRRSKGEGPPYVKLGRRIVYMLSDLQDFLERHRVDPEARQAG